MSDGGEARQVALDAFPENDAGHEGPRAHVDHPFVREGALQAREYQERLAERAVDESLLVVLPTGLGKTAIAALVAAERLRREPDGQVLVVAPTRPLVRQHAQFLRDVLRVPPECVVTLTGRTTPAKRAREFDDARVVVATPQTVANDVTSGRVSLARVTLLVVDEAHRTVGDYPYVALARAYLDTRGERDARILALTASPGSRRERVTQVLGALGNPGVEVRGKEDSDVRAHVKPTHVDYEYVSLPGPMLAAREELAAALAERVRKIKPFIPRRNVDAGVGKGALIATGEVLRARLATARGPSKGFLMGHVFHHSVAMQLAHAIEALETQGLHPFRDHVDRLARKADPSRAQKAFLKDERVHRAYHVATKAPVSHPKELALLDALDAQFETKPDSLVLVFAQYRDTVRRLVERIGRAGMRAERFVGQASRDEHDQGLTQDEQSAALARFSRGDTRVLVATSVAEEGLHVPSVDLVVFYEPVPSEIRTIQRRGRTGRDAVGRVLVLVTSHGLDEAFRRVQEEREAEMRRVVDELGRR